LKTEGGLAEIMADLVLNSAVGCLDLAAGGGMIMGRLLLDRLIIECLL